MMVQPVWIATGLAILFVGGIKLWVQAPETKNPEAIVNVPDLSLAAVKGKTAFDRTCAACHGDNATGSANGPPLLHKIYEPGHHGDASFHLAVKNGVRAHHWRFGNMPPQTGVTEKVMVSIVIYVREMQRANGIF